MKKFKKLALAIVFLVSTIVLSGCGGATPTDVVNQYFTEIQTGNYVWEDFMETEDGENPYGEFGEDLPERLKEKLKSITFTINSETIEGEKANVNVTVKGLDFDIVLKNTINEVLGYVMEEALAGKEVSDEAISSKLTTVFNKNFDEVTFSEKTLDVNVEKVDGKWTVIEDDAVSKLLTGVDENSLSELE